MRTTEPTPVKPEDLKEGDIVLLTGEFPGLGELRRRVVRLDCTVWHLFHRKPAVKVLLNDSADPQLMARERDLGYLSFDFDRIEEVLLVGRED